MLQSIAVKNSLVILSLAVAAALPVISNPASVSAQQVKDTKINITVCSANNASGFTIDSPVSDSVVNTPNLKMVGSVTDISQIDFFVNDTYKDSIAISNGATSYSHNVKLSEGTSTVKLVAYDMCQGEHEKSVVVTYQRGVPPGGGSTTTTEVPAVGGPVAEEPSAPIIDKDGVSVPESGEVPVPQPAPSEGVDRGLDLDTSLDDAESIIKTVAVVAGIAMLAALPAGMAHIMLPLLAKWRHKKDKNINEVSKLSTKHHHHLIMRLFGLALIIIPLLV